MKKIVAIDSTGDDKMSILPPFLRIFRKMDTKRQNFDIRMDLQAHQCFWNSQMFDSEGKLELKEGSRNEIKSLARINTFNTCFLLCFAVNIQD